MWNERFSGEEYVYGTEPNDFLKENRDLFNTLAMPQKILCLGEGEGRNAVFLAQQGHQVWALDYAQAGLEKTRQLAEQKQTRVHTIHADLTTYALPEAEYEAVIMIFCHLPSVNRPFLYEQVRKTLKPGGIFLAELYTPEQLAYRTGGPGNVDMLVSQKELEQAFASYAFLLSRQCVRDIHEGRLHTGKGAVVQFIARKP